MLSKLRFFLCLECRTAALKKLWFNLPSQKENNSEFQFYTLVWVQVFSTLFLPAFFRAHLSGPKLRLNTSRYAQWAKQLPTCNNDRPSVTCRRLGMASTSWLRRISKVSNSTLDCSSCSCTSVTCLDKPWNLDCNNTWRGALVLSAQRPQHSLWA